MISLSSPDKNFISTVTIGAHKIHFLKGDCVGYTGLKGSLSIKGTPLSEGTTLSKEDFKVKLRQLLFGKQAFTTDKVLT